MGGDASKCPVMNPDLLPPGHPPAGGDISRCPMFNPSLLPPGHPKPGDANWSADWRKCPALAGAFAAAASAPGPFQFPGSLPAPAVGTAVPAFGAFGAQTF